jgi:hypothetical protein
MLEIMQEFPLFEPFTNTEMSLNEFLNAKHKFEIHHDHYTSDIIAIIPREWNSFLCILEKDNIFDDNKVKKIIQKNYIIPKNFELVDENILFEIDPTLMS